MLIVGSIIAVVVTIKTFIHQKIQVMKKITTLILLCTLCLNIYTQAQTFGVQDATIIYKGKARPSIQAVVEPDPTDVKKAWDDFLKDNYDVNLKGIGLFANKDILTAEDVRIGRIDQEPIDLFTRIIPQGNMSKINLFMRVRKGKYLGPDNMPVDYNSMKAVFKNFLRSYLSNYYLETFNDLQDEINEIEKNRIDLLEDNSKLVEDIQKNETAIAEMTQENEQMNMQIGNNKLKVEESITNLNTKRETLKKIKSKMSKVDAGFKGKVVSNE